jgi:hypothetical protein
MVKFFRWLLIAGFALLPFSTQSKTQESIALFTLPFPFFEGFYSPGLAILWLACIVGVVCWFQGGARIEFYSRPYILIAYSYVVLVLCLLPVVPDIRASLIRASSHLLGVLLFSLLVSGVGYSSINRDQPSQAQLPLLALAITGTILSLYYLLNTVAQTSLAGLQDVVYSRYTGGVNSLPWGASNIVAAVLIITLCAAMQYYTGPRQSRKMLLAVYVIASGVVATLSRNGALCLVLIILSYGLIFGRQRLVWMLASGLFFTIILLLLIRANLLTDIVETRTSDFVDGTPLAGRQEIWSHYIEKLGERPFGFNGFYASLGEFGFSPHNWFLVTYWELGFLGVGLGLALVALPLIEIWRESRRRPLLNSRSKTLLLALSFTVFLNLQVEDPQFSHQYIVCWWTWQAAIVQHVNLTWCGKGRRDAFQSHIRR